MAQEVWPKSYDSLAPESRSPSASASRIGQYSRPRPRGKDNYALMLTPRTSAELTFIADTLSRVPDVEGPEDAVRRQGLSATADARDCLEAHFLPDLKSLPID